MSFISKWKEKRESCGQFLKFLSRTIRLEDAANQPFPYKSFRSIHISGSPCGWYYLLTTIQTILRQYNYAVTLTLNFVVVFFTPTAPSQTPQEYPAPFCMTKSSCDLPFSYHRQNILVPVIYFPLTPFHSPCSTSSCSSQRRFHFPSQANSLEVCRNRGRDGKTETGKVELSPATHTSPHPALPACNIQVAVGKAFYTLHQTPSKAHT